MTVSQRSSVGTRGAPPNSEKAAKVRAVLDAFIAERASGKPISRHNLESMHRDLMPDLGWELDLLAVLDAASRRARAESSVGGGGGGYRRSFIAPARIGGYLIKGEIHRGAQGVVYLATEESTGREAAVKVLHPGYFGVGVDSGRFEREVAILRRLRHPGIVAVRDSGVADGCHYFAMDYVEGDPLDRAIAGSGLSVEGRLRLFVEICDAVAAAHVRGVIHRDLKPANIRVDRAGRPHVLDFGLAKLTEGDGAKSMTEDGQFLGSLPWASPEQVSGGGDVDVRSDVYSLGVVLHQMLTGEFPYTVVGPVREVVRTITEVEPRAASARNPEVGDEVDTIVLRCLNKAPERRYQSAGEISADVRRYLADEPIEAKRDSSLYVLKKHVRRHRTLLLLGLGLAVSLLAFAIHANVQAAASRSLAAREAEARVAAETARREAAVERDAARDARDAEQSHRREAEFEAARARAVTEFFVRTFGVSDPNAGENGGVTLLALVTRAAAEVGTTFETDPASEAAVRLVLGRAFATFGRFEEAREHLARAVELHERTLQSPPAELYEALWTYAAVLEESSPRAEWRSRCRQLWALYPRLLAADAPVLSQKIAGVAARAFDDFEPATHEPLLLDLITVARETLPEDSGAWLMVADAFHLAGTRLGMKFKGDTACRLLDESLRIQRRYLAETNMRVVRTIDALVSYRISGGEYEAAAALARGTKAALGRTLPADHWLLAIHDGHIAVCDAHTGAPEGAEQVILDALRRVDEERGASSLAAIELAAQAASLYETIGRAEVGRRWRREVASRLAGSNDTDVVFRIHDAASPEQRVLADRLMALRASRLQGRVPLSPEMDEVLASIRAAVAPDEPFAAIVSEFLYGVAKAESNRTGMSGGTLKLLTAAAALADGCEAMVANKRGTALWWLGYQLETSGDAASAEPYARKALALFERSEYEPERLVPLGQSLLGSALSARGDGEAAEELLREGFLGTLKAVGVRAVDTEVTLRRVLRHYQSRGGLAPAVPLVRMMMEGTRGRWEFMLTMLDSGCPEVAGLLRAVQLCDQGDRAAVARTLGELVEARRRLLPLDHPFAPFYADAMYTLVDNSLRVSRHACADVWAEAVADLVAVDTACCGAVHIKTTYSKWWEAYTLLAAGDAAAALKVAEQEHWIRSRQGWKDFAAGVTRCESMVLMAREASEGTGRSRGELSAEYQELLAAQGAASIHTVTCFGAAVAAFGAAADGEGGLEFVQPVIERAIAEPGDGRSLRELATRVMVVDGLPESVYALAARAAIAASEVRPDDPLVTDVLPFALWKSGQRDAATKAAQPVEGAAAGPFSLAVRASAGDLGAKVALRELLEAPAWKRSEAARALRKIAD